MMYQFELYVPEIPGKQQFMATLESALQYTFNGYTRYHSLLGYWRDRFGTMIEEKITVYRMIGHMSQAPTVLRAAEYVKKHWNQESVLWTVQPIDATFT